MSKLLVCEDLTFWYDRKENPVFSHISLSIGQGEAVLLMGPSGCGKSTLAYCLAGLYPEYAGHMEGNIFLGGPESLSGTADRIPLAAFGPGARARRLSVLFQNPDNQFCMDRVDHEVMFTLENRNYQGDIRARARSLLAQVGLSEAEMSPIHTLSGGMKQKLALCTALATEAEMLILDEPFANLDPASCAFLAALLERLNRQGMTLLVVDHRPGWWRPFLSRIIFMEKEGDLDASGMTAQEFEAGRDAFVSRGLFYDEHWLEGVHPPGDDSRISEESMVKAENLTVFHGKKPFMEHLSFQVPRGRVTALVGACGSGKTTLLHALAGIGRHKGKLWVGGRAGLVFQNPRFQFLARTVEEEILMTLRTTGRGKRSAKPGTGPSPDVSALSGKADALLEEFGLLPFKMHSPYALSQGQQRRLALLSMLACDCPLMLLDEPTYAQDEEATRFILDLLKRRIVQGLTVIMATHDLALAAAFAGRIFLVDQGQIRQVEAGELSEGWKSFSRNNQKGESAV